MDQTGAATKGPRWFDSVRHAEGPGRCPGPSGQSVLQGGQSPTFFAASAVALVADFAVFFAPVVVALALLFGACERLRVVELALFAALFAEPAALFPALPA